MKWYYDNKYINQHLNLFSQVVNFEFSDGATATLTMIAFTEHLCSRKAIVYGTHGQLTWDESKGHFVEHYDFLSKSTTIHESDVVSYAQNLLSMTKC